MSNDNNFDEHGENDAPRPRLPSAERVDGFDGLPLDVATNAEQAKRRKALIAIATFVLLGLIGVAAFGAVKIFGPHGAAQSAYATPTSSPGGPEPAGTFGASPYGPTEASVTPAPVDTANPYAVPTATADPLAVREQAEQRQLQQQQELQAQATRQEQAQQLAQQQDEIARRSQAQTAVPPLASDQGIAPSRQSQLASSPQQAAARPSGPTAGEFDVGYGGTQNGTGLGAGTPYAPNSAGEAALGQPGYASVGGSRQNANSEAAHADRQLAFVQGQSESSGMGYVAPVSRYLLNPTTVITARLISDVNSDLPGPVEAEVTQRVYTSNGHRVAVIPEGTRVFGTYDSALIAGQNRLLMAWTELDFANGCSFHMGALPATDAEGRAGLSGHVDNHSLALFRSAALLTILGVAEGVLVPQNTNILSQQSVTQQVGAAAGAQLAQLGNQLINRQLNRQPTITIDSPYEFQIVVTKPLPLDEYQTAGSQCFPSAS